MIRCSIGSSGSTGGAGSGSLDELLSGVETLELLELLELLLSGVDTLVTEELLSSVDTSGLLKTLELSGTETPELLEALLLEKLLSVVDALELCAELLAEELLTVPELCEENAAELTSTLITVLAPEVSEALLHPVRFTHIIMSDSAAAKNSDFLFIYYHSIMIVFQTVLNDRARVCRVTADLRRVTVKAVVVDHGSFGCGFLFREYRIADAHDLARDTE